MALSKQFIVEVTPLWVFRLNQVDFPCPSPFLNTFFTDDGTLHSVVKLGVNKLMHAVGFGETLRAAVAMLPNTACKVTGDADIERSIPLCREDVDTGLFHVESIT